MTYENRCKSLEINELWITSVRLFVVYLVDLYLTFAYLTLLYLTFIDLTFAYLIFISSVKKNNCSYYNSHQCIYFGITHLVL